MWKILQKMNKNLIIAIPLFLLGGFIFGISVDPVMSQKLKSLIVPLTVLMVFPMMVTLNIGNLKKGLNYQLQATAQLINFIIIPIAAFVLGKIFFPDQPFLALGLLLASLLPTSGMTISWTGCAKGNMGAAINMTVIGLTLGSIVTPFYVQGLMGATIEINLFKIAYQILVIVFLPMVIGQITRLILLRRYSPEEFKKTIGPRFPAISSLGVLGIVFVAMALKARGIMAEPQLLAGIIIPLLILYSFNFTVSTLIGRALFQRGDAIALVYGTVMRNLSIALAVAINAFGQDGTHAALVIALAYIIQVQSAAWYVKLTDRFFGPPAKSLSG
jgi:ACR3 family arsenite transporter